MTLYRMSLFKRISKLSGGEKDVSENFYSVFGHFDFMEVDKVERVNQTFRYQDSKEVNKQRFINHTLMMYSLDDKYGIFEDEAIRQTKILMVSSLKLNMCGKLAQTYDSYGKLKRMLQGLSDDIFGQSGIKTGTFMCLGSFDVVFVAAVNCVSDTWQIPIKLRAFGIVAGSDDSNALDTGHAQRHPLFLASNSFVAVHKKYDIDTDCSPINVQLRFALDDIFCKNELLTLYKSVFGGNLVKCHSIHGEFDCIVFIKDCPFDKLVSLRSIGLREFSDEGSITGGEISEYIKIHKKYIRSSDVCLINPRENLDDVPAVDYSTDGFPDTSEWKKSLLELKERALLFTPIVARRTLRLLVDKCLCLLDTPHRYYTGARVYLILREVLETISINGGILTGESILRCLGNIGLTLNISVQTDNIELNYVEGDDVETFNPLAKLLFAQENMLRSVFDLLSGPEQKRPLIFLTINPVEYLKSEYYFSNSTSESKSKLKDIINVNMPSVRYYDPERCMPYLIHEISHYIDFTNRENTGPSLVDALEKMLDCYVESFVWGEMRTNSGVLIDYNAFESFFKGFLGYISDIRPSKNSNGNAGAVRMTCDLNAFCRHYAEYLRELYISALVLKDDIAEIFGGEYYNLDLYYSFLAALRSLAEENGFVEDFQKTVKESEADLVMCEVCGLTPEQYIKAHFEYLHYNLLDAEDDFGYKLRVSAVLSVIGDADAGVLGQEYKLYKLLDRYDLKYGRMIEALGVRLAYVRETVRNRIEKKTAEDDYAKLKNLTSFFNPYKIPLSGEYIDLLLREWYDNWFYWRSQCNERVS